MFKRGPNGGIKIGKFEYSADWSALVLLYIVCQAFWSYAGTILEGSPILAGVAAISLGIGLIASLLLHEAGHSYTSVALGVPISGIKLWALGGMAMMTARPKRAHQEFLIAIAGPLVSMGLWLVLTAPEYFGAEGTWAILLGKLGFYNLALAVFNMVPAFPMDGGRVFRAFLWKFLPVIKATTVAVRISELIAISYVVFAVIVLGWAGIFWPAILAGFLFLAGESELRALKKEQRGVTLICAACEGDAVVDRDDWAPDICWDCPRCGEENYGG